MSLKYFLVGAVLLTFCAISSVMAQSEFWAVGYLASYTHLGPHDAVPQHPASPSQKVLRTSEIDWSAITHLIYSAMRCTAEGGLAYDPSMDQDKIQELIDSAHSNTCHPPRPVLLSIGAASDDIFPKAIDVREHRTSLIQAIMGTIRFYHFDGVDIDFERSLETWPNGSAKYGIHAADSANFVAFVNALHDSLAATHGYWDWSKKPLLTGATLRYYGALDLPVYYSLRERFDKILVMTYDFSTSTQGGKIWNNSNLYNNNWNTDANGNVLPSTDGEYVNYWLPLFGRTGDVGKLLLSIDFYGYNWHGPWTNESPGLDAKSSDKIEPNIPYWYIMEHYYPCSAGFGWDGGAHSPYIGIASWADPDGLNHAHFIPFENQRSIAEKVSYATAKGLGGVFIWDIGAGYRRFNMRRGEWPDSLLQTVKIEMSKYRRGATIPKAVTAVAETSPHAFSLVQNYPNPFNPVTTISYTLPVAGPVRLSVYNQVGQEVQILVNDSYQDAGPHTARFDGAELASGIYYYRLTAGSSTATKRMQLLK